MNLISIKFDTQLGQQDELSHPASLVGVYTKNDKIIIFIIL